MALDIIIDVNNVTVDKSKHILTLYPYAKTLTDVTIKSLLNAANTKQFWLIIGSEFDHFDFSTEPDDFDKTVKFKAFCISNGSCSIVLVNRLELLKLHAQKKVSEINDILKMTIVEKYHSTDTYIKNTSTSIILLSYYEQVAVERYTKLVNRFGNRVKHIANVSGIVNAHYAAAQIAESEAFYVVDADAEVLDDFVFDFMPDEKFKNHVHVWRSKNPLNGLTYGYGGVKMFSKSMFNRDFENFIDLTTSISSLGTVVLDQVANITDFNVDPLSTWRSAFRECAKLSSRVINNANEKETAYRLNVWTSTANGNYSDFCLHGAREGKRFGEQFKNDLVSLNRINDFKWLADEFRSFFGF